MATASPGVRFTLTFLSTSCSTFYFYGRHVKGDGSLPGRAKSMSCRRRLGGRLGIHGRSAARRLARMFMSKYLLRRPRSRRSLFSRARRRLRVEHTLGRVLRAKRTRPGGADRVSSPPPPPGSLFCKIPNFTPRNYAITIGEHACPCGRGFTCSPIRRAWRNGSSACGSLPNLNRAQHDGSPKELC